MSGRGETIQISRISHVGLTKPTSRFLKVYQIFTAIELYTRVYYEEKKVFIAFWDRGGGIEFIHVHGAGVGLIRHLNQILSRSLGADFKILKKSTIPIS